MRFIRIKPANPTVSTIYYPGVTNSQVQMAKYTGLNGFTATTGERVSCHNAIDVITNPFIGTEIKDVNLDPFSSNWSYFNPVKLISAAKSYYSNRRYGIQVQKPEIDDNTYQKGSVDCYSLNFKHISIGQESDINSHLQKYQLWKSQKSHKDDALILYGVSRGAATTFNAMATHQYENVKLVILEGCFYTLQDVIQRRYYKPCANAIEYSLSCFAYKQNGPSPAGSVANFPKDVPVVFISSLLDGQVPYESTQQLAQDLADKGENPVYLLTLNNSSHPKYMFDDKDDRDKYENFIHAIYQKYQLPCNTAKADLGKWLIEESRILPSVLIHNNSFLPLASESARNQGESDEDESADLFLKRKRKPQF